MLLEIHPTSLKYTLMKWKRKYSNIGQEYSVIFECIFVKESMCAILILSGKKLQIINVISEFTE